MGRWNFKINRQRCRTFVAGPESTITPSRPLSARPELIPFKLNINASCCICVYNTIYINPVFLRAPGPILIHCTRHDNAAPVRKNMIYTDSLGFYTIGVPLGCMCVVSAGRVLCKRMWEGKSEGITNLVDQKQRYNIKTERFSINIHSVFINLN